MDRETARLHLINGGELDGLVLTATGDIVARGKVRWQGTTVSATKDATCTRLQLSLGGDKLEVPFVDPVPVKRGEALKIAFGPLWQSRG
jgi:hypothetical protein